MRKLHDEQGLSLVELVVAVLVLSFVMVAGTTMLINSTRSTTLIQGSAQAATDGQVIARSIASNIRNASCVNVGHNSVTMKHHAPRRSYEGDERYVGFWAEADGDGYIVYGRIDDQPVSTGGTGIFIGRGVHPGGADIFGGDSSGVSISMEIETATTHRTDINTTAVPRYLNEDEEETC
ncbi:prepilin-type N-terminal cleavage/methylation domain-containing protein [Nesterenkonia populi]|uniref:prepilin-type N-terminal cleavage/methylation domain-containing protein n=1 Tax=Nesterenkonia populi TaxID=1591087 RepID=UPI0011BF1249|nr:prepilin-type N-terminal cleavage/methylation domain-containing protein [Nesterenkonia populi]